MIRVEQLNNKDFYVRDLDTYALVGRGVYDENGKATITEGDVGDVVELAEKLFKPFSSFDKHQEDLIAIANFALQPAEGEVDKLGILFMPQIDIVVGDMRFFAQYVPGLAIATKRVELHASAFASGNVGYVHDSPIHAYVFGEWLIVADLQTFWFKDIAQVTADMCFGMGKKCEVHRVTNVTQLWEHICEVKEKCSKWDRGLSKPVQYR